ncbi:Cof-type HAD-IIB family hydrolase [Vibrio sp. SS-MA-C1-2]|uniref:Cof-type HAD-IIB family hydrolase n=1 Tax=Vibrio sp. SS-MA-C1-2 TaxID=2908646 RepID=UPI001F3118AD|nr:Cof-type HAD-IIB family hydrolase [Vibrio sp. SS-MA-C1-2]UJF17435.1 Cof-type HAD-IIB family hydrolase [Vibrio sp. SS-MA-C1-2]
MYKLIALDLDGTLLNNEKKITERNQHAIAAARAMGVTVILASGRPLEGMAPYLEQLGMNSENDYVLSFNGSRVQRVSDLSVIRQEILTGLDAKRIANKAQELGVNVQAFTPEDGLITPAHSEYTQHEADINGIDITLKDFSTLSNEQEVIKTMMIDSPDLLSKAIEQLPEGFYQDYTIVQSAPFFLEFLNPNSDKGVGVKALADHLGIDASEVICMGDAENDHHMLEYAGLAVAMGNATPETKALADHITDDNENSGVGKAIEKFVTNI